MITNPKYKSKFVEELETGKVQNSNEDYCPDCKMGKLIQFKGVNKFNKKYTRITCSNSNFGCEYINWVNN